jgi:hypothetical protein
MLDIHSPKLIGAQPPAPMAQLYNPRSKLHILVYQIHLFASAPAPPRGGGVLTGGWRPNFDVQAQRKGADYEGA